MTGRGVFAIAINDQKEQKDHAGNSKDYLGVTNSWNPMSCAIALGIDLAKFSRRRMMCPFLGGLNVYLIHQLQIVLGSSKSLLLAFRLKHEFSSSRLDHTIESVTNFDTFAVQVLCKIYNSGVFLIQSSFDFPWKWGKWAVKRNS